MASMSIEQNKQTTLDFFSHFNSGDIPRALGLTTNDATWWIAGKPGVAPVSGEHSKQQLTELLNRMASRLPRGLEMTVKAITAEDDRVAVEVESYGELDNGRVYNQEYHMAITFLDGKIAVVREYLDTQHVFATWFAE